MLYGRDFLYDGINPYVPTDIQMGMAPIMANAILHLDETVWYVLGENFTPYCQLTRDGRTLDAEYITPWLMRLTEDPETTNPEELEIRVVDKHNEILSDID